MSFYYLVHIDFSSILQQTKSTESFVNNHDNNNCESAQSNCTTGLKAFIICCFCHLTNKNHHHNNKQISLTTNGRFLERRLNLTGVPETGHKCF